MFSMPGKVKINSENSAGRIACRRRGYRQCNSQASGYSGYQAKEKTYSSGKKITDADITLFTRQLATMMKAGVPLAVI
jgi:type II secretory pathway component PulF